MNGENKNEDVSENRPELSAMEAALAELRPRRETRFAADVKRRIEDALSGDPAPLSQGETTTVKISLTRYIRIAQFNAAAGGLLAGLLLGVLLGGAGVYLAMNSQDSEPKPPVRLRFSASSPFARRLLQVDASLTPLERALLEEFDKETRHGGE